MMTFEAVLIRLILITIFSGIIGYERELNQSHAGLKTHMIVGLSATVIALIQQNIISEVIQLELLNPEISGAIRSDPARLIAQVISGIGFLGGGTIIVTKRNVSGLTTAASIWAIAALGIGLGMGYYKISITAFFFLFFILMLTKYLQSRTYIKRVNIEYVGGRDTVIEIEELLKDLNLKVTHLSYSIKMFGEERIYSSMFELTGSKVVPFHEITTTMVNSKFIISIHENNLE